MWTFCRRGARLLSFYAFVQTSVWTLNDVLPSCWFYGKSRRTSALLNPLCVCARCVSRCAFVCVFSQDPDAEDVHRPGDLRGPAAGRARLRQGAGQLEHQDREDRAHGYVIGISKGRDILAFSVGQAQSQVQSV